MKFIEKKNVPVWLLVSILLILALCFAVPSVGHAEEKNVYNIAEKDAKIRVFVGMPDNSLSDPNVANYNTEKNEFALYTSERTNELLSLEAQDGDKEYSAILLLNEYYDESTVASALSEYNVSIIRGYMWIPGETGRIIFSVEENNIVASVRSVFGELSEMECDDATMKEDISKILDGNYGLFSIVVSGKSRDLKNLLNCDIINFVDVKYNAEAEALAAEQNTQVSYIELPCKPDGMN